ncbi:MAG: restriction endonuclease, partial [Intestinibacter sp.]
MKNFLEVKEFDSIICNKDYKNDHRYKFLNESIFNELLDFIRMYSSEDDSDLLDFMKISYKRNVGDIINIRNYVGLIQMDNGYQVQILPKISFGREDYNNEQTKRVFIKMLRSMKDFPSKVFDDANLKVGSMNLYEIFINMYLQEVRRLVKHGIKSSYVTKEENSKFYKGKLLVNKNINENLIHKERFYVEFDEYDVNRAENKVIKSTLLKLQKMSNSAENLKEIRKLLVPFGQVKKSINY